MPLTEVGFMNGELIANAPTRGDAAVTQTYLTRNGLFKLGSVGSVDFKTVGQSTIIASATANTFPIFARVIFDVTNTVTVTPTVAFGTSPGWNNFIPATAVDAAMTLAGMFQDFKPVGKAIAVSGGSAFKIDVTVGATATTCTGTVELWGSILPPP